jgi:peptidylprolyl isomerase
MADETLPNGVTYSIKKSGTGPKANVGELMAIRFAAYNGDIKIDDIFETPEPYYTRMGSGGLLKGVESVLPLMKVGDRWVLSIPVSLSFSATIRGLF